MPERHAAPARSHSPRYARNVRADGVMRGVAIGVLAVVLFGATSAAAFVARLSGNTERIDASDLIGAMPSGSQTAKVDPQDTNAGRALNILIMGSDQRDGENATIGGETGGRRSDTTMIMHISADRSRVEVVSVPRDSLVQIPECQTTNGVVKAHAGQWNDAFANGWDKGGDYASAAACTVTMVQATTGVPIDHFVIVDFAGFQKMVDAIGGVPFCFKNDMQDDVTGLDVKAGQRTLDGTTALQFARARHGKGVGDGSDTNRIGHQQELVAAMAKEVMSRNVLTNAPQLFSFLDAASEPLKVDSGLSTSDMVGLAYSLRSTVGENIRFMTIPFQAAPQDKNRVVWTSAAAQVWQNLASDVPALGEPVPTAPTAAPTTAATQVATPAPAATPTTTKAPGDPLTVDDTATC